MADKLCFVQFPHPRGEHRPDGRDGKTIGWNKGDHKRKFMELRGAWIDSIDSDAREHTGNLRAWGEWEPESKLVREFVDTRNDGPRWLWRPYWAPRNDYRGLQNTDPFIFGERFLYSNCHQANQKGLRSLARGSVIAFGSTLKGRYILDTVFVVADSFEYDPREPRAALEGKASETFLSVTGEPLAKGDYRDGERLRLYRGATWSDRVDGMYSFFPAIRDDGAEASFPRPFIELPPKDINPSSFRVPKGAGRCRAPNDLRRLWGSLVEQVRGAGLVLGTRAEEPPRDGSPGRQP